jgi:molybdate transport system ATP-binding protein
MNRFRLQARYDSFELDAEAAWDARATALFGASGSGKTTILEAIAGLRPEVQGDVTLRERALGSLRPQERRIGWVPQDASLFPRMTVAQNVEFGASHGRPGAVGAGGAVHTATDAAAIRAAIDALEVGPLLERRAAELSGGERQRVAIARALASRPDFLLLDEPLASIDRPLRARIVPYLQRLATQFELPFLLVTHDPLEVTTLCEHVLVVEDGRCVASGSPHDLFPAAETFGWLRALAAENRFDVKVESRGGGTLELSTAAGTPLTMADVAGTRPPARVAVRAEDLLLAAVEPVALSAQNVLAGIVIGLESAGAQQFVDVELTKPQGGGTRERWRARVTRRAVERLALAPGKSAWLVIKAHAIVACE